MGDGHRSGAASAAPGVARSRRQMRLAVVAAALLLLGGGGLFAQNYRDRQELLMANPDTLAPDSALVRRASANGEAAFQSHCASCHGRDMKGSQVRGVPDLTDDIWLYDFGRVSEIERTILYGIRSGLSKAHNVTDMPAIGVQKILTPDEIKDVIAYTLSLSKQREDPAAVERGEKLFQDKGVCYDCHSRDAAGIPDYGAPNLTDDDWLYGGDEKTLYKSIYDGRHGSCPGWIGVLPFSTIREIAIYIHANSEESPESPSKRTASDAGEGQPG
jgi:cytochrome c oxidase cbb3-type subunit 3